MAVTTRQGKRGPSYRVTVDFPRDPITGKRRQRTETFRTKKEALAREREWLTEIERGTAVDMTKMTVGEYLAHWLATSVKHSVRNTTYNSYEQLIRIHIAPALGAVPVQKLMPAQVQAFYQVKLTEPRAATKGKKTGTPLSPRTVRYLHTVLREALQQAVKWGIVYRNVCDATEPPRAPRPQISAWTGEEMRAFLAAAKEDDYRAAWILALTTGLRRGELLGLRWQDVDLARGVLHVRQSLVEIGANVYFHEPKTKSGRRVVALTVESIAALTAHRDAQTFQRKGCGDEWRDHDLVFTVGDGGPIRPRNFVRRYQELVTAAGVPILPFHSVRHAHATALLKRGVNLKIVSERLGHSGIQITADTYSHVTPDMQRDAITGLDAALFG
jgi:integrase